MGLGEGVTAWAGEGAGAVWGGDVTMGEVAIGAVATGAVATGEVVNGVLTGGVVVGAEPLAALEGCVTAVDDGPDVS